MREHLTVETEQVNGAVVVRAVGEIDIATASALTGRLREALHLAASGSALVVDLLGVQFIGSAGLAVLVEYEAHCQVHRVPFRIVVCGGPVERVLQVSALHYALDVYPTVDEAVAHVDTSAETSSRD